MNQLNKFTTSNSTENYLSTTVQSHGYGSFADGQETSILDLVTGSGIVVQGVLVLLVIMSVVTWGIVLQKYLHIRRARIQSDQFDEVFWSSSNLAQIREASEGLKESPIASVYFAGHRQLRYILESSERKENNDYGDIGSIERALKRAKANEITNLEKGTTFLATTASAAPFIGLFGTVWGIMNAFIGLSSVKTSSIQAVAPGISEALIATAIGLGAAIPAAVAYNYFSQQVKIFGRKMDMFSAEFVNLASRHFL